MTKKKPAARKQAAPPPKTKAADNQRAELIDEFGAIAERLQGLKRLEKRYERLRAIILQPYADRGAEESIYEAGGRYSVVIGPRASQRTIVSMSGLCDRLGAETFMGLCRIPLEELDKVILARDVADLVVTGLTGPRTVKALQAGKD